MKHSSVVDRVAAAFGSWTVLLALGACATGAAPQDARARPHDGGTAVAQEDSDAWPAAPDAAATVDAPAPPDLGPAAEALPSALQIARARTTRSARQRNDLRIATTQYEPVPTVMFEAALGPYSNPAARRFTLAGDAAATRGFSVDNFVLIEVFDASGRRSRAALVGRTEPVTLDSEPVEQLGASALSFAPGAVDVGALIPASSRFTLRVTTLDYGGLVGNSDIFLVAR